MSLPVFSVDLRHDERNTGVGRLIVEVAGLTVPPGAVNVQVQRVETPAVSHHAVKQTEPLTLLQTRLLVQIRTRLRAPNLLVDPCNHRKIKILDYDFVN